MLGKTRHAYQEQDLYATRADFCRIFKEQMDRLYLLSYLLTADEAIAEKCFVRGLHGSTKSNVVFKEWADYWARRTIIRKAIQLVKPVPGETQAISAAANRKAPNIPAELAAVTQVPVFERFVFVMSVLERYSDQECALLLHCMRADVAAARTRALQQIGASAELRRGLAEIREEKPQAKGGTAAFGFGAFSPLTASA
jgi:DNA-directed RNA polymerase specialized sigma24 family protein